MIANIPTEIIWFAIILSSIMAGFLAAASDSE
jgi:hypothetical protein